MIDRFVTICSTLGKSVSQRPVCANVSICTLGFLMLIPYNYVLVFCACNYVGGCPLSQTCVLYLVFIWEDPSIGYLSQCVC